MNDIQIQPPSITLPFFGGITIPETLLSAICVSIVLIIAAVLLRIFLVTKRMKEVPRGIQNVLEIFIDSIERYSIRTGGSSVGVSVAPYIFTLAAFIVLTGLGELFRIRPNTTDINSTIALALITFVIIRMYAIKKNGWLAPLRELTRPVAPMAPITLLTQLALPISMACRLFGNILGGMIVMDMIYSLAAARYVIPAFLSMFFTLFHSGMQTYIFITLTLIFIDEAVEKTAPRPRKNRTKASG